MCFAKRNTGSAARSFDNLNLYHEKYNATIQFSAETELSVTRPREPLGLMLSSEEAKHMEYITELAINDMSACSSGGSCSTESLPDGMESEAVTLSTRNIARTMVLEAGPVGLSNTLAVDCNQEGEPVENSYADNVSVTGCYISWSVGHNEILSEEETDTNTNECSSLPSVDRSTPSTLNKEPAFKELRPFNSVDDGTSHNESTLGILPSGKVNHNYSDLSFKARIAGLSGGYCEKAIAEKSHDHHQLTLPCTTDDQVKPDSVVVPALKIVAIRIQQGLLQLWN